MTTLRRMGLKLGRRDRILLAVLGTLALLGGTWWFYVKPATAELTSQRSALERVTAEAASARDVLARLRADYETEAKRTAERLRTAKALPDAVGAPGTVIQLERLAARADVELTRIQTNQATVYGGVTGHEYEVQVTGRFFNVDDFLYRMHRQVAVDEQGRPIVGGRLFAITSVDLSPEADAQEVGGANAVKAVLRMVAFTITAQGAATAPGAPTQPVSDGAAAAPGATPTDVSTTTPATTTTAAGTTPAPGATP